MGIEQDIKAALDKAYRDNGENELATSRFLGVENITFRGWRTGKRFPGRILFRALDALGAKLIFPGDAEYSGATSLKARNEFLEMQVRLLEENVALLKEVRERERERERVLMIEMTSTKNTIVEDDVSPTITARMGTGGNQVNAVLRFHSRNEAESPAVVKGS